MAQRSGVGKGTSAKPQAKAPTKKAPARGASVAKPTVKKPPSKPVKAPASKKAPAKAPAKAAAKVQTKAPTVKKSAQKVPQKAAAKSAAKVPASKAPAPKADAKVATPAESGAEAPTTRSAERPPSKPARKPARGPVSLVLVPAAEGDLLTVRGAELLATADVVVTDVAAAPLAQVRSPRAEIIPAVDELGLPLDAAGRVRLVTDAAAKGANVVRLICGEPVFDGTLAAEGRLLTKAKYSYEVAPGVSLVTGTTAYTGILPTAGPGGGTAVVSLQDEPDWGRLASTVGTIIVRDGADAAADIAAALLDNGMDPTTPMAVTRGATTVEQRTVSTTLGTAAPDLRAAKRAGPGMLIVGEAVAGREALNWFESKPLFGWRVLIPRTTDQSADAREQLRQYGATSEEVPTISVEPPRTPQQMDRAIQGLVSGRYQWIAFTSANAVKAVRERLEDYGLDARALAGVRVAAVDDITAQALIDFGVRPELVPAETQTSAGLAELWPPFESGLDPIDRVFLPRADIATEALVAAMTERGWQVDDIVAYRTVRAAPPPAPVREAIKTGGFDAVLFTSSSTVRNLVGIAGKPHAVTVVACVGPKPAEAAREHSLRVDVQGSASEVATLIDELAEYGERLRVEAADRGESTWRPSRRKGAVRRKSS